MSNENGRPEFIHILDEGPVSLTKTAVLSESSLFRALRFCRMFPDLKHLPASGGVPTEEALIELGKNMKDDSYPFDPNRDSQIPAGYTYLMQFINHDIAFSKVPGIPSNTLKADQINMAPYPSLNLDSVYGLGPNHSDSANLYDGNKLRLGKTKPGIARLLGKTGCYTNDLRRDKCGRAVIGNPLNDENLALAQTHVAFLKFHNSVVNHLKDKVPKDRLFQEARKTVVQHYQSIVLYDALPRHVDREIYKDVLKNGRQFFFIEEHPQQAPCLPVEFAFAAFRFGHSMVRNFYEWNDIVNYHGEVPDGGSLKWLFTLTKGSGDLRASQTLPSEWIVDWRRLYDNFPNAGEVHEQLNHAHLINTNLAADLHALPGFEPEVRHSGSLVVLDLLAGRTVGLPTGQEVAAKMRVQPFTGDQAKYRKLPQPQRRVLEKHDFKKSMPLWYYILGEAAAEKNGEKLGEVGSRIVVETVHALIEASPDSILPYSGLKSNLTQQDLKQFTMPNLLKFIYYNSGKKEINPLEGWADA